MAPNATGRFLAKVLGIDLDYRKEQEDPLAGSGGASVSSVDTCTSLEWSEYTYD